MITVNHPLASDIMNYLYVEENIKGNEDHLIGTKVEQTIASTGMIKLESHLSKMYDENIELKGLTFITI